MDILPTTVPKFLVVQQPDNKTVGYAKPDLPAAQTSPAGGSVNAEAPVQPPPPQGPLAAHVPTREEHAALQRQQGDARGEFVLRRRVHAVIGTISTTAAIGGVGTIAALSSLHLLGEATTGVVSGIAGLVAAGGGLLAGYVAIKEVSNIRRHRGRHNMLLDNYRNGRALQSNSTQAAAPLPPIESVTIGPPDSPEHSARSTSSEHSEPLPELDLPAATASVTPPNPAELSEVVVHSADSTSSRSPRS